MFLAVKYIDELFCEEYTVFMETRNSLTPQQVAGILNIAKNTVYELIKRGELNAFRIGNKMRIEHADIESYKLKTRNTPPRAPEHSAESYTFSHAPVSENQSGNDFIICGQDVMLDIISRQMDALRTGLHPLRSHQGSYNGLYSLYQQKVHAATAHLWDGDSDSYNVSYVRRMLPGIPAVIIHLACRMQGFFVASGNPKSICTWTDLARKDITLINREKGSGTRILLDENLRILGIPGSSVNGYDIEGASHLAVASAVARGKADAGLGNEKSALQVKGVDFIPLQKERYEMIIRREDFRKKGYSEMLSIIRSDEFKTELEGIGGYDLSETGKIIAET
jgi:putative molybdopterin biosynthesis protein